MVTLAPMVTGKPKFHDDKIPVVELTPFLRNAWRPSNSVAVIDPQSAANYRFHVNHAARPHLHHNAPQEKSKDTKFTTQHSWSQPDHRPQTNAASRSGYSEKTSHQYERAATLYDIKAASFNNRSWDIKHGMRSSMEMQNAGEDAGQIGDQLADPSVIGVVGKKMGENTSLVQVESFSRQLSQRQPSSIKHPITGHVTLNNSSPQNVQQYNHCMPRNIYDVFDRASTLPSITVRNAPMRKRKPKLDLHDNLRDVHSTPLPKPKGYRLGVTNTLDFLQQYGKPAQVEQHLSTELRHTLENIRKNKDIVSSAPLVSSLKTLVPTKYISNPTMGEKSITTGLTSNSRSTSSVIKPAKTFTSLPLDIVSLSRCSTLMKGDLDEPRCTTQLITDEPDAVFKVERLFTPATPATNKTYVIHEKQLEKVVDTQRTVTAGREVSVVRDNTWSIPPPSRDPPPLIPPLAVMIPNIDDYEKGSTERNTCTPDTRDILEQSETVGMSLTTECVS